MSQFDTFINSPDNLISQAASMLNEVSLEYQEGHITKAEHDELCGDILDFQKIQTLVTNMDRREEIYSAFKALSSIVGIISSL